MKALHFYLLFLWILAESCSANDAWVKCKPSPGCSIARCDPKPIRWFELTGEIDEFSILCQKEDIAPPVIPVITGPDDQEIEELRDEMRLLKRRMNKLEATNLNLVREVDDLKASNNELEATNLDLARDVNELKASNNELKATNLDLARDVNELKASNNELKATNLDLAREVNELKASNRRTTIFQPVTQTPVRTTQAPRPLITVRSEWSTGAFLRASNNRQYKHFPEKTNYEEAERRCHKIGGRLASTGVRSSNVRKELQRIFWSNTESWIGLKLSGRYWSWSDRGRYSSGHTPWAVHPNGEKEPNGSGGCARIVVLSGRLVLADARCDSLNTYLCEK